MTAPSLAYIFVDDSGTLSDPNEAVVTVVALITRNPSALQWIIRRIRRDVKCQHSEKSSPSEFKFYNTTSEARGRVLAALANTNVQVHALSAHKGRQRIEDTPENYAILLCALLEECMPPAGNLPVLLIDQHFSQETKRTALSRLVQSALGLHAVPKFVDSRNNPFVQLADFAAGAVKYAHTGRSTVYRGFIEPRIAADELRTWRDLKREWLERVREKEKWQTPKRLL